MNQRIFNPKRYGMVICQYCNSAGYIQYPKRRCCPECGGFGFIKRVAESDTNTFTRNEENEAKKDA